jgi:hypothetical protein
MPNWCHNYLEITAEPRVITALLAKAKGKSSPHADEVREFSYLPFLQEHIDACEDYKANWYEFNISKLGCKWFPDIESDAIRIAEGRLTMAFPSPWSPPAAGTSLIAGWLRSQGFAFQLKHAFVESGMAFCGVFTADEHGQEYHCGDYVELDAEDLRTGKQEDYTAICQDFDISFPDLQARATEDRQYVTLCPDYFKPYLN